MEEDGKFDSQNLSDNGGNEETKKRFAKIGAGEMEEPTAEDLSAFAAADAEDPAGNFQHLS